MTSSGKDFARDYENHPPIDEAGVEAHAQVRTAMRAHAQFLTVSVPLGPERSIMYTRLEEAGFWANAGIARARYDADLSADTVPPVKDLKLHGIGWAVKQLRSGERVTRRGWNGPGQYLELQVPDKHSKMTCPYVYICTTQGDFVPWPASQADLLGADWERFSS